MRTLFLENLRKNRNKDFVEPVVLGKATGGIGNKELARKVIAETRESMKAFWAERKKKCKNCGRPLLGK